MSNLIYVIPIACWIACYILAYFIVFRRMGKKRDMSGGTVRLLSAVTALVLGLIIASIIIAVMAFQGLL